MLWYREKKFCMKTIAKYLSASGLIDSFVRNAQSGLIDEKNTLLAIIVCVFVSHQQQAPLFRRYFLKSIHLPDIYGFSSLQKSVEMIFQSYKKNESDIRSAFEKDSALNKKSLTSLLTILPLRANKNDGSGDSLKNVLTLNYYYDVEQNYDLALEKHSSVEIPEDTAFEIKQSLRAGRALLHYIEHAPFEMSIEALHHKAFEIIAFYRDVTETVFKVIADKDLAAA